MTGNNNKKIKHETENITIRESDEIFPGITIIKRGIRTKIKKIRFRIMRTTMLITRKDQKFSAPALKNSFEEKLVDTFFRVLNNPPTRKVFIIKPATARRINPVVINEDMVCNTGPRSVKTSIFNPEASFSVIMLPPVAVLRELRKGRASRLTRASESNQKITTPFLDLIVRIKPELIAKETVIKMFFTGMRHLNTTV